MGVIKYTLFAGFVVLYIILILHYERKKRLKELENTWPVYLFLLLQLLVMLFTIVYKATIYRSLRGGEIALLGFGNILLTLATTQISIRKRIGLGFVFSFLALLVVTWLLLSP